MSLPVPPPPAPGPPNDVAQSPLPPPPPSAPIFSRPVLRAGQLTSGWRNALTIGWVTVVLALAAVWKSSWTLGFPTWWLGPQANPRFPLVIAAPFVLPVLVVIGSIRNTRYVVVLAVVAALVQALIGWGDVGRQDRLALVELAIAAGALAVSLAAFAGLLSRQRAPANAPRPAAAGAVWPPPSR